MKTLKYLSPTSFQMFNQDLEQFYLQYLSDCPPPRPPQTRPMSIGSSFDAYCKSYIHESLYGKGHKDSNKFQFDTIFSTQVEESNRDWARVHGKYAFDQYTASGSLADLMIYLESASSSRLEFEISGIVSGTSGVPLLGRPDANIVTKDGAHIVLDWKVNGYCSRATACPGYIQMKEAHGHGSTVHGSTVHGKHKNAYIAFENGIKYNAAQTLDVVNPQWAAQLCIYSWLLGEPVGGDYLVAIDQLACSPGSPGFPNIKIAQHRCKVSTSYQHKLFASLLECWDICNSGWIFREISREESIERCKILDNMSLIVGDDNWFSDLR